MKAPATASATAPSPAAWRTVLQFYRNPLRMFEAAQAHYGDVVRFEVMGYTLHQVTSAEGSQHVLTSPHYTLSGSMDSASPFVGRGLASNIGESWVTQRRLMQPVFQHKALEPIAARMVAAADAIFSRWQPHTPFDILHPFLRLNHQILGEAILGIDFAHHPDLLAALSEIRLYLNRRFHALVPLPANLPIPRQRRYQKAVTLFDQFVDAKIAAAGNEDTLIALLKNAVDPKTGQGMSAAQLHDEINTLFFNGYDDPGSTLTWAVWLLGQHPEIEGNLRAEINTVLGSRPPTFEDLPNLPYTRRVIDETLRLYPPTWSILRDPDQDDEIDGFAIPKGSTVLVNIYLLHRHPRYWDEPTRFNPDRFLTKADASVYLPFGAGSRRCIGQSFALMEIQLCLVRLLQCYQVEVVPQPAPVLEAISSLKPQFGLQVRLTSRAPAESR